MRHATTAALGFLVVLATTLSAQEGVAKRPAGTWDRTEGEVKIRFEIKAQTLRAILTKGDEIIQADVDYGVSKDSILFGRVNQVDKKGTNDGPAEGTLFSFRFAVKDKTMKVSDYVGPGGDEVRQLIEGEYKGTPAQSGKK